MLLIVLCLINLLARECRSEWHRLSDFSAGLFRNGPEAENQWPYARTQDWFLVEGKSLKQIDGVDSLHRHFLAEADKPVRGLYRYYDQETGQKEVIAACGAFLYHRPDGDTFCVIGDTSGTIALTQNSSKVIGVGTHWHNILAANNGSGYKLLVKDTVMTVNRILSDRILFLDSAWAGATRGSQDYALGIGLDSTHSVQFQYWQQQLFIADGGNPVWSWTHDEGLRFNYWIVDSVYIDSVGDENTTSAGTLWPRFWYDSTKYDNSIRDSLTSYRDQGYCLSWRDTSTDFGFHKPLPIFERSFGKWIQLGGADTGLFTCDADPPTGAYHAMDASVAYIVKPMDEAYAFHADTIATGTFESRTTIYTKEWGATGKFSYTWDYLDENPDWLASGDSSYTYNTGTDVIAFTNCGNTAQYPFRSVNRNGDSITIRVTSANRHGTQVIESIITECMDYVILRLYYYPCAEFIKTFRSRLWFFGVAAREDRLYYSQLLQPYNVKILGTYNPWYLDLGDKATETGMGVINDRLYLFKTRGIWQMTGGQEYDFDLRKIYSDIGSESPYAIVEYYNGIYFVGPVGVYRFDGQSLDLVTGSVKDIFDNDVNASRWPYICIIPFEERFWIGYGVTGYINDKLMIHDFKGASLHANFNPYCFAVKDAPSDTTLMIGTANGRVFEYGNISDTIPGVAIMPIYQTPFLDFGAPELYKKVTQIEVKCELTAGATLTLIAYKDYGTDLQYVGAITGTGKSMRALIDCNIYGYAVSLQIGGGHAKDITISEISFNVEPMGGDENVK